MESISLKKIAQVVGAKWQADWRDCQICNICTDTRKIEKGCLFIAFSGERFDAHNFAAQAAENGAVALICQKPVVCDVPVLYVDDTREAYLNIAGYYRSLFELPLVGITGSVGKTTTKEFIALALSAKYKTLKTEGNFNNEIGMSATLLRLDKSCEAAVIEMGMNHFGEIHRLTLRSKPTIGVITNIGVSHIENLGSRDGILKAKLEILDGMSHDAPLILNADNDKLAAVKVPDRKVYYFGIEAKTADFKAENIQMTAYESRFDICYGAKRQAVCIPAIGAHNVLNALCAFAVGIIAEIDPQSIAEKLAQYVPAGMRQRQVDCGSFTVIEDCYNASPDSMRAAISTLLSLQAPKSVAVLADMLELGTYSAKMHREIGIYAAQNGVNSLLCYGEHAKDICEGAKAAGMRRVQHFESADALLQAIENEIEQGSAVLFKGSHGMHLETVIEALYERKGIK